MNPQKKYQSDELWSMIGDGPNILNKVNNPTMDNEKLGQAIDSLDNVTHALQLPLSAEIHVEQLRKALPNIVQELKDGFVEATGENPWE